MEADGKYDVNKVLNKSIFMQTCSFSMYAKKTQKKYTDLSHMIKTSPMHYDLATYKTEASTTVYPIRNGIH